MNSFNAQRLLVVVAGVVAFAERRTEPTFPAPARPFPIPSTRSGRRLPAEDRRRTQLSIDRLRWRHQADQGEDRHLRRSDMPLKPEELQEAGLVQFPMIIGGVVPVVNIKGVQAGQLVLDGHPGGHLSRGHHQVERPAPQEGSIQSSRSPTPRSPRCTAPMAPDQLSCSPTTCRSRARSSSRPWCQHLGQWPLGIGAKGNEGVANMTHQTDGAIGYVEYAYAKQNQHGVLRSSTRRARRSFPAPRRSRRRPRADWLMRRLSPDPHRSGGREDLADHGVSFILVYAVPPDPAATGEALSFRLGL